MQKINAWQGSLLALVLLTCIVLIEAPPAHTAEAGAIFTRGPDMNVGRDFHTMVTLPGGKAAVFGGENVDQGSILLTSAEIWNPATNHFTVVNMNYRHYFPGLAKLANGDYLLAGGGYTDKTAEIYHPGTNTFTPTTHQMNYGRNWCGAATLTSGKVLVVGAFEDAAYLTAATYGELFNPTAGGSFTTTQALNSPRSLPLVLPCNDGSAVVLGGHNPTTNAEYERVELYNPMENAFTILQEQLFPADPGYAIVGYMAGAGSYTNSVETQRLQDGRYLMLAKKISSQVYTLFTFDPATKQIAKFVTTPALPNYSGMLWYPLVDAPRGKAYILQSENSSTLTNVSLITVELASGKRTDPTGTFTLSAGGIMLYGITLLPDGRLFLAGGIESGLSLKKTWFINPNPLPVGGVSLLLLD